MTVDAVIDAVIERDGVTTREISTALEVGGTRQIPDPKERDTRPDRYVTCSGRQRGD
jgi:hypothetical protein